MNGDGTLEATEPPETELSESSEAPSSEHPVDDSFRALGTGAVLMVTSTICLFAFTFVGRVATARVLSVESFGEFNLGVSFTSLLSVVILLGLNEALARMLAHQADAAEQRTMIRWALWVSAAASIIASVLVFVFADQIAALFHDPNLVFVFELLAVSVGFGAITPVFAGIFQGFRNAWPNAVFNQILNPALFVVFVLLFLYFGLGLTGALVAYVLADAAGFIGIVLYYRARVDRYVRREGPMKPRPNPELWRFTVALWGVASFAFITAYADTLILGAYWPATQVGYYSTAMTMARVVLLGGSALTFVFLPVAAMLGRRKDFVTLKAVYATASRWIMILTVPLFLLLAFAPGATLAAIFGDKYLPAAPALQILAISAFISTIVGPVNACLGGLGLARNQLAAALASAAVNIGLSFALIPKFGILGAAASWGIARAMYPLLGVVTLYRGYRIHSFTPILVRPLVVTFALTIPVLLALMFFPWPTWLVFPLFVLASGLFVVSLLVTRSLTEGDFAVVGMFERITGRELPQLRQYLRRFVSPIGPEAAAS